MNDGKQSADGTAAEFDTAAALAALEQALGDSLLQLNEAASMIVLHLGVSVEQLRHDGIADKLWTALDDLQSFVKLAEEVVDAAGLESESVGAFDTALSEALASIETALNGEATPVQIADLVERELRPAVQLWDACRPDLERIIAPAATS